MPEKPLDLEALMANVERLLADIPDRLSGDILGSRAGRSWWYDLLARNLTTHDGVRPDLRVQDRQDIAHALLIKGADRLSCAEDAERSGFKNAAVEHWQVAMFWVFLAKVALGEPEQE